MSELDSIIKMSLERATTHTRNIYGKNQLTGQELVELVNRPGLNLAATVKADQHPHLSPVDVNIVDDRIYIGIDEGTARHKNLIRNPNVAIMITDESRRQAIIEGEVRMIDTQGETAERVFEAQKKKYGWTTKLIAEVFPKKILTYKRPAKG